jgi:amidase
MLDCVGPFARDTRVLIDAMAAIAPDSDRTAACESTAPYTVGIVSVDALASISAAVARAPAVAGLASHRVELSRLATAFEAGLTVINAETRSAFGPLLKTTTMAQLGAAEVIRREFPSAVDRALDTTDVIVLPTLPDLPISIKTALNETSVATLP